MAIGAAIVTASTTASAQAIGAPRPVGGAGAPRSAPASTLTRRSGAAFFLHIDHLVAPRGGLSRTRGDVGVVIRPIPHLALDVGIGFGGGQMLRLDGTDGFAEFGLTLDARVFLNPHSRVQVFLVGGFGLGAANASLRSRVPAPGEDCPADGMFFTDVSGGVGVEVALGDSTSLVATARLVRRDRLAGDLTFAETGTNPSLATTNTLVGASVGLSLNVYRWH